MTILRNTGLATDGHENLAVVASGLTKRYGGVVALDGLDLSVPTGTVLGLLGPNGAGKTTAVSILTTLIAPDSGSARVAGVDVVAQPQRVRSLIGLSGHRGPWTDPTHMVEVVAALILLRFSLPCTRVRATTGTRKSIAGNH